MFSILSLEIPSGRKVEMKRFSNINLELKPKGGKEMGKKTLFTSVFVLLAVFCLFDPFNTPAVSAEKQIKLSFANFFPASHFTNKEQFPLWIKEVEQASGGRVKITNYPGQTLLEAAEMFEGVKKGTADISHGSTGYHRGVFPVTEAFELPGIYFGSATANSMVMLEGYKKFKPAEFSDVKVMYLMAVGPGFLYTKKPVRSLDDLKGMRLRATGPVADCLKKLGATPIAMTMPEVYEALSKGVLDGQVAPPEVLEAWKQAEVLKYIVVVPPIYASIQYCVMNLGKWKLFSEKEKEAIEKVNEGFYLKAGKIWDANQKKAVDFAVKKHGMKIIRLSPEENAKWMAPLESLKDDYIAKVSAKGLPGKEILNFVIEKAAIYSKKFPTPLDEY
jgi:TRAP-type C4-dicarboxylate transport system substrate-binding protein